jgi:transcriptional regulator with XRE-family HTH domain
MSIRTKSKAIKDLEKIRGGPLSFSDLLHSTRLAEEVTQVELAEMVGTSKSKICDFEKGRRAPSLEMAAEIANALGASKAVFVAKLIEDQIKDANLKLKIKIEAA